MRAQPHPCFAGFSVYKGCAKHLMTDDVSSVIQQNIAKHESQKNEITCSKTILDKKAVLSQR